MIYHVKWLNYASNAVLVISKLSLFLENTSSIASWILLSHAHQLFLYQSLCIWMNYCLLGKNKLLVLIYTHV